MLRLNRLQRAYAAGYRRGLHRARAELRDMRKDFDAKLASLDAKFDTSTLRLELARLQAQFDAVTSALRLERCVKEAIIERATTAVQLH